MPRDAIANDCWYVAVCIFFVYITSTFYSTTREQNFANWRAIFSRWIPRKVADSNGGIGWFPHLLALRIFFRTKLFQHETHIVHYLHLRYITTGLIHCLPLFKIAGSASVCAYLLLGSDCDFWWEKNENFGTRSNYYAAAQYRSIQRHGRGFSVTIQFWIYRHQAAAFEKSVQQLKNVTKNVAFLYFYENVYKLGSVLETTQSGRLLIIKIGLLTIGVLLLPRLIKKSFFSLAKLWHKLAGKTRNFARVHWFWSLSKW